MATFKITPPLSALTSGDFDNAFDSGTPFADALIVDFGAFLRTVGSVADGALLVGPGAWTVTVNGVIEALNSSGIVLTANPAVSTITINGTGRIAGVEAIRAISSVNIKNLGLIEGNDSGVILFDPGAHTITNSGTIFGGSTAILDSTLFSTANGLSNEKITNTGTGTISGYVNLCGGNDTVINAGQILGDVSLGVPLLATAFDTNKLTNSGTIDGSVGGGEGDDTVTNSKNITGDIYLQDGKNSLTNSGTIGGGVDGGDGNDTVINSGEIGSVYLGDGDNKITNSGTILGFLSLGNGNDIVLNTGVLQDFVILGGGNDIYNGGSKSDWIFDSDGADTFKLAAGDDRYDATGASPGNDGNDNIDGGAGEDLFSAVSASSSVFINLDIVGHDTSPFDLPGTGFVAAKTATGADISGIFTDTIINFENASGWDGDDNIYGSAAKNYLIGQNGNDYLAGFGGNDTLEGGAGSDRLFGGAGKDLLIGGPDSDIFLYQFIADSKVAVTARDSIGDFEIGDRIDLSRIDANTKNGAAVNDLFDFIGADPFAPNTPGQLRYSTLGFGVLIEGEVNGDGKADFAIELLFTSLTLTTGEFML